MRTEKINWIGPVSEDDNAPLLDEANREAAPETAAAMDDMFRLLQERDYPAEEIFPLLIGMGHPRATVLRAKTELKIASVKRGRWYWHLPVDEEPALSEA